MVVIVAENLEGLCPVIIWKVELVKDKLGYWAEIFKQIVKGTAWFVLLYSKLWEDRDKLREEPLNQKLLDDLVNAQPGQIAKIKEVSWRLSERIMLWLRWLQSNLGLSRRLFLSQFSRSQNEARDYLKNDCRPGLFLMEWMPVTFTGNWKTCEIFPRIESLLSWIKMHRVHVRFSKFCWQEARWYKCSGTSVYRLMKKKG